jgi:hypothetical protein
MLNGSSLNFPDATTRTLAKIAGLAVGTKAAATQRRECPDQMIVFGEAHLRRMLSAYATYCNQARTRLALDKDAPFQRTVQRRSAIVIPILAWLHHRYVRI